MLRVTSTTPPTVPPLLTGEVELVPANSGAAGVPSGWPSGVAPPPPPLEAVPVPLLFGRLILVESEAVGEGFGDSPFPTTPLASDLGLMLGLMLVFFTVPAGCTAVVAAAVSTDSTRIDIEMNE